MDPRFQSSFIPKKPIASEGVVPSHTVGIFAVASITIFLLAIVLSGGVFAYKRIVAGQIVSNKVELEQAKENFDLDLIEDLMRLDKRIDSASTLLNGHVAVTGLLSLLEQTTLKTVRLKGLELTFLGTDKISIELLGEAASFTSVALQADEFNKNPRFINTVVDDLSLEQTGTVAFKVITSIDPTVLKYSEKYKNVPQSTTGSQTATSSGATKASATSSPATTSGVPGPSQSGTSSAPASNQ